MYQGLHLSGCTEGRDLLYQDPRGGSRATEKGVVRIKVGWPPANFLFNLCNYLV